MKSLIITAHPSAEGFTHQIAKTYKKARETQGGSAEIINLYTAKWQQPYLSFQDHEHFSDWPDNKTLKNIQQKIKWADELIFCFPVWWYGPPAVVKNFFDTNFTSGFGYKYGRFGIPKKLLKGRTAKLIVTAGGPAWLYRLGIYPLADELIFALNFCGINTRRKLIYGNKDDTTPEQDQKFLEKVIKSV